jgi:hypothetical protein
MSQKKVARSIIATADQVGLGNFRKQNVTCQRYLSPLEYRISLRGTVDGDNSIVSARSSRTDRKTRDFTHIADLAL